MPTDVQTLQQTFDLRVERYGPQLREGLAAVYGDRADETADRVLRIAADTLRDRPADLRRLDEARLLRPDWLQGPDAIGYVTYTDRFAGTLNGVAEHLDHLESLGVTYLHLMPLLTPREGENDGGYAVKDFRSVRPDLGTMDDLAALTAALRPRGISLVMDLVLNHVADQHEWVQRARAGEQKYRDYFHTFTDRADVDAWEATLPEIFPDFAPGNFTYDDDLQAWVWTTFNRWQWDLNWANPDVFCEFVEILCHLANQGAEVFRLDAIAFIWKELGTDCQNEPPVHFITQALRAALRIAAPATAFKAEAIVGPADLIGYLGRGAHHGLVSDMAYHNSVMVQLWSALASRDVRLFEVALSNFPPKPTTTTWGTYVRCHDDIGWAVSDSDAGQAGLDPFAHRRFLSDFYSGDHPGSFATGLVFQENRATGDRRISGTLASLAGLEKALAAGDDGALRDAIARIVLLNAVILGFGGVPLLYMGDEVAMLNDHSYLDDPEHAADNRWVHRPKMDWDAVAEADDDHASPQGQVLVAMRHLIGVRKRTPHLHASVESRVLPSPDPRILLLTRDHPLGMMVCAYNLSEDEVELWAAPLRDRLGEHADELISGNTWSLQPEYLRIRPYQPLWLVRSPVE
ncbi:alpha-amylase family protein [Aestuariimicrobium ganziense]|uniref:alpha-amylase family protein n=1 Tax=Aestuariimicrobium ganziense TaxID=2773677 RepID=UPI00194350EE|nr:alpha-amylase family protein [Aestuariimicrobium ganziense]